jgi:AraC family transcriptional regulator
VLDQPIELSVEDLDGSPSLRKLCILLVAQEERWLSAAGEGPEPDYRPDAEMAQVAARHLRAGQRFRSFVERVTAEGQLDDTVVDTFCDPPQEYTYGGIIAHVLTFAAHRRTVAIGALHSAGITELDSGDPRVWVVENAA